MSDTEDEIKRLIEDLSHPERSRGTASHQRANQDETPDQVRLTDRQVWDDEKNQI